MRGNRPFSWITTAVHLARNDRRSLVSDQQAIALVTDVVTGKLESVQDIAGRLAAAGGAT